MKTSLVVLSIMTMTIATAHAADVVNGKAVYEKKCAMCHGKDLKGAPAMAKVLKVEAASLSLLTEDVNKATDADLIKVTADGDGKKMPAFKGKLTDAEIADSVAYIRSLGPTK